jgi:hypothetical protein
MKSSPASSRVQSIRINSSPFWSCPSRIQSVVIHFSFQYPHSHNQETIRKETRHRPAQVVKLDNNTEYSVRTFFPPHLIPHPLQCPNAQSNPIQSPMPVQSKKTTYPSLLSNDERINHPREQTKIWKMMEVFPRATVFSRHYGKKREKCLSRQVGRRRNK